METLSLAIVSAKSIVKRFIDDPIDAAINTCWYILTFGFGIFLILRCGSCGIAMIQSALY